MKRYAASLFALVLLVACSEESPNAPSSAAPSVEASDDDAAGRRKTAGPGRIRLGRNKETRGNSGPDEGSSGPGRSDDGATGPSEEADGSTGEDGTSDDSGGADAGTLYPTVGRYVYTQRGYEKFCSKATCDRQDLPPRQDVRITLRDRTKDQAVVVTRARASDDRMLRTTATYKRANALITDVYTRLTYEGFAFENQYHPAPPVESLRFPLRDGAAWRGTWRDSTSGSYEVTVFGPSTVSVRGRAVRTFQVATTTEFEGEFTGEAKTLSWIDPATKAVVKLSGSVDLDSAYGRYATEFSTSLRSGPRY